MEIKSVNIGKPRVLGGSKNEVLSGINKTSVGKQKLFLSKTQLDGDGQADLVNHGGIDKAVCIYPVEHLLYWQKRYNQPFSFGAFGENLSISGLTEEDVHIGDRFKWGSAIIEVSQPRRPCFKLAARHGIKQLPLDVQQTGYSGYYVRVIQEGFVSVSDPFILESRGSEFTIAQVNTVTYSQSSHSELQTIATLPLLSEAWKISLQKKLKA